jgi:hypothetical protein
MPPPAATQAAARLWTAWICSWVGESGCRNNAYNTSDKPPSWVHHQSAGSVSPVHMRACMGIKKFPELRNRPKSDTWLYELFWSQRPRKSPPAARSSSRETPCIRIYWSRTIKWRFFLRVFYPVRRSVTPWTVSCERTNSVFVSRNSEVHADNNISGDLALFHLVE